jgi:hypothetical protein
LKLNLIPDPKHLRLAQAMAATGGLSERQVPGLELLFDIVARDAKEEARREFIEGQPVCEVARG